MKEYDDKAVSATLSEEMKQAGQEYPHLEQVYMKVFGKPLPESRKPTIKENGREIYYPASASASASASDDDDDDDDDDDAKRASLVAILSCQNQPVQDSSIPLNSKEPVQDASSCQQNKDWFHREFYTDYDPDDTERAERVARFREHLNELDAIVHG